MLIARHSFVTNWRFPSSKFIQGIFHRRPYMYWHKTTLLQSLLAVAFNYMSQNEGNGLIINILVQCSSGTCHENDVMAENADLINSLTPFNSLGMGKFNG